MIRERHSQPYDLVVEASATPGVLYRLFAVEPHGWSTVLIEDQAGTVYLCTTSAIAITEISTAAAQALLENRSYRRWLGAKEWTSLADLPLISDAFSRMATNPPLTGSENSAH